MIFRCLERLIENRIGIGGDAERMKKFLKWMDEHFEETILVIFLIIICVLMMLQVILRYVFRSGIIWTDEVCRLCFVATAFLGISYSIRKGVLMRFDSVQKVLPKIGQLILELLVDAVMLVSFAWFSYNNWIVVTKTIKAQTKTVILRWPYYIVYAVIFVCFILATLRALQKLIKDIRGGMKNNKEQEEMTK